MSDPSTDLLRQLEQDFADIFEDDKREDHLSDPRYIEQQVEEEWE